MINKVKYFFGTGKGPQGKHTHTILDLFRSCILI